MTDTQKTLLVRLVGDCSDLDLRRIVDAILDVRGVEYVLERTTPPQLSGDALNARLFEALG